MSIIIKLFTLEPSLLLNIPYKIMVSSDDKYGRILVMLQLDVKKVILL